MIENLLYIVLALFGLGILVFIHELGHYIVARRVGMKVEAFGIGFGKPFYTWEHKGVKWNLCWLPFGGYVRIAGMEKEGKLEPHQIPDGFFGKKPIDRIKVALAGPIVNLIFAFLAFALLWGMGGRLKSFSDFTHLVGWVEPGSSLYSSGMRPGDEITTYNKKPFTGFKDFLYAALLENKCIDVKGYEIDYTAQTKKPFDVVLDASQGLSLTDRSIMPMGMISPASFLIYQQGAGGVTMEPDSPMVDSGIQNKDRIIWVDGQMIFSRRQLVSLINEPKTLLTVERDDRVFLSRVPRVKISDLRINSSQKAEFADWQHAANLKNKVQQLYFIPYSLDNNAVVEKPLVYIDENSEEHLVSTTVPRTALETPLEKGDRILAIDGVPVDSSISLLQNIQTKRTQIIVERGAKLPTLYWNDADKYFASTVNWKNLNELVSHIGMPNTSSNAGDLYLLAPITPKALAKLPLSTEKKAWLANESNIQKKEIEEIEDPQKRAALLNSLHDYQNQLMLGIPLQDEAVVYNPSPIALFLGVFDEIWRTLVALFTGYLSPKGMAGPVGIVQVMQFSWMTGVKEAIFWMAAISLNLGVLNLLPIPVLDGGHICFSLYEMITKKPIKAKVMERLIIPFVVLLVGFFIYLTYQDLSRIVHHYF